MDEFEDHCNRIFSSSRDQLQTLYLHIKGPNKDTPIKGEEKEKNVSQLFTPTPTCTFGQLLCTPETTDSKEESQQSTQEEGRVVKQLYPGNLQVERHDASGLR